MNFHRIAARVKSLLPAPSRALVTLASLLLVAACAGQTASPAAPLPRGERQAWEIEWDDLAARARQEGELSLVADPMLRPVFSEFERKFGVKVLIAPARGSAILDQLAAERAAGRYLLDVHTGSLGTAGRLETMGAAAPTKQLLFHPEVTDETLWLGGKHFYGDVAGQYNFLWGGPVDQFPMSMSYNTNLVTPQDISAIGSVWDLLNPRWRGSVTAEEIQTGLSGYVFPIYAHPEVGPTWLERYWTEMSPIFYTDTRVALDGLALGKYAWLLSPGAVARDVQTMHDQGLPVDRLVKDVKETRAIPVGQGIMAIDQAPHPNATKLFINWFLSREGQTDVHTMATTTAGNPPPSWREDLTKFDTISPNEKREPGKQYLLLAQPEIVAKTTEAAAWQTGMREKLIGSRR